MLQKLGDQIRICHEHAINAKRRAEESIDLTAKADFLEMEKRWLALARSYEFTEKLGDFTGALTNPFKDSGCDCDGG